MKHPRFLVQLVKRERALTHLKKREMAIFNVCGRYGQYQIMVGPENSHHHRPIEINGRVHHLFLNRKGLEALPTKEEVDHNLKGMIIMNEVTVHLFDKNGDGKKILVQHIERDVPHARENINLAGDEGPKMLRELEESGKLADEAYQIVQKDILRSIGS